MYQVTVRTIRTRARQKANLEGASQFITDPEWVDMISVSYAEFYDLVRETSFGGQYYRKAYALPGGTAANVSLYALPLDFVDLISVDLFLMTTGTQAINVWPYQEEERNRYRWLPYGNVGVAPFKYQLQGPNISFIPTPQGSTPVTLNYVPIAATLTSDDDAIDSINGWEEWIVLDVAIKALVKDGQMDMIGALEQQKANQAARIASMAPRRDQYANETVHDVVSYGEDGSDL